MFDNCVNKYDFNDVRHLACSEVRPWPTWRPVKYINTKLRYGRPTLQTASSWPASPERTPPLASLSNIGTVFAALPSKPLSRQNLWKRRYFFGYLDKCPKMVEWVFRRCFMSSEIYRQQEKWWMRFLINVMQTLSQLGGDPGLILLYPSIYAVIQLFQECRRHPKSWEWKVSLWLQLTLDQFLANLYKAVWTNCLSCSSD